MVNVHESDYEQYNEYSFHFGLLFFRFLRIEQTDLDQFVGHVGERRALEGGSLIRVYVRLTWQTCGFLGTPAPMVTIIDEPRPHLPPFCPAKFFDAGG